MTSVSVSAQIIAVIEECKAARNLQPLARLLQNGYALTPDDCTLIGTLRINSGRIASSVTATVRQHKKDFAAAYRQARRPPIRKFDQTAFAETYPRFRRLPNGKDMPENVAWRWATGAN